MDRYKIFIIDDAIDNLKVFISIFEQYCPQYDIFQTNNPQNALKIASKVQPNLIITDWDMPHFTGIDVIDQLKNNNDTKDIPVIMATGVHITSSDLQLALETGAVDFIRKPIDPIELVARAHSSLMISELQRQLIEVKNQELTENSLYLVKSNEFNIDITKKLLELNSVIEKDVKKAKTILKTIIKNLNSNTQENSWLRFNLSFDKVHKDFNRHMLSKFPNLTSKELKLCAFIRLGMNNKDIASVLNQNPDSIKVSRSRLRKKLGIEQSQNLETYLAFF